MNVLRSVFITELVPVATDNGVHMARHHMSTS